MINHVREYREYKGVSLRWLARKVGCGASTISAIERGKCVPSVYLALRIAKALLCAFAEGLAMALEHSKRAS